MEIWSAHQLYQNAESSLGKTQALNLRNYANNLKKNNLPVIFTLRHLSKITGVDYRLLRSTVSRRRESANYRMFAIKKRSGGRRHIHAVTGEIFKVQHFINSEILKKLVPHNTLLLSILMVALENVQNSIVVLNGSSNSTFPISFIQ